MWGFPWHNFEWKDRPEVQLGVSMISLSVIWPDLIIINNIIPWVHVGYEMVGSQRGA